MVSLDALAQRYNLLPTEALARATTFDLRVMEVGNRYQSRKQTMSQGKTPAKSRPKLSEQEMRDMIERVKQNPRKIKRKERNK